MAEERFDLLDDDEDEVSPEDEVAEHGRPESCSPGDVAPPYKDFAPDVVELLQNLFANQLTDDERARAEAARDELFSQKPISTSRQEDGYINFYADWVDLIDSAAFDKMLLAGCAVTKAEDIRKIRTHTIEGEFEQLFDDVIEIIESGEATKVMFALCPLKDKAANGKDPASRENKSSQAIASLYPDAVALNFSQLCARDKKRTKTKPESCCSKFNKERFLKRLKIMQIKIVLLQRLCPHPPKVSKKDRG